jgi:glutathione S-transferase
MELELISFKLCPFAQRAMISLEIQKIDFKMTYINPRDPPDLFKEISLSEQVPLLKVDDQVIFEIDLFYRQ